MQLRVNSQALMQDIIRDTRSQANQVDQLFHDVIDRLVSSKSPGIFFL